MRANLTNPDNCLPNNQWVSPWLIESVRHAIPPCLDAAFSVSRLIISNLLIYILTV